MCLKKVRPFGFTVIFYLIAFLGLTGFLIYKYPQEDFLRYALLVVPDLFCIFWLIKTYVCYVIFYDDQKIWIGDDYSFSILRRIQYETVVPWNLIKDYDVIESYSNSRNLSCKPKKSIKRFLEITTIKNEKHRIYVSRLSPWQIDKLCDLIKNRMDSKNKDPRYM